MIAQALLADPRLLLLDEPLSNLDIAHGQEIIALVDRVCRSRKIAVLLVTHDINPLLSYVDRVLYMANGRCAVGTPEEVITRSTLSSALRQAGGGGGSDGEGVRGGSGDLMFAAIGELYSYQFIQNALMSGLFVAVAAAVSGYFLVGRGFTFAGHALPNIGFAGAAGAVLIGVRPVYGLFAFTILAAVGMGLAGRDVRERDVSIGVIMTFGLGLGLMFLSLYAGYAARIYSILFGTILGISREDTLLTGIASLGAVGLVVALFRPLSFSTFDPAVAAAKGVPLRLLSVAFLIIVAITVSLAVQVMGAMLVFTLLVGPGATATRVTGRPVRAILLSTVLGVVYVFVGITLAGLSGNWPVSFFIATISFLVYLPVRAFYRRKSDRARASTRGVSPQLLSAIPQDPAEQTGTGRV